METKLVFCNKCDKATYSSGTPYHLERCNYIMAGYDCYCLEGDNVFCNCEVGA